MKTGGMLRGNIIVQVSESVKADAVVLELGWYTQGLGSSADEAVLHHTFRGELLNSGRELTIPFAVQIPEGSPITYQGTLIKLDWRCRPGWIYRGSWISGLRKASWSWRAKGRCP